MLRSSWPPWWKMFTSLSKAKGWLSFHRYHLINGFNHCLNWIWTMMNVDTSGTIDQHPTKLAILPANNFFQHVFHKIRDIRLGGCRSTRLPRSGLRVWGLGRSARCHTHCHDRCLTSLGRMDLSWLQFFLGTVDCVLNEEDQLISRTLRVHWYPTCEMWSILQQWNSGI